MLLVRLLGQAASGVITSTGVVALLGFAMINYLPVLLSLTLFIAVLMALTRSYRDSEMVVWFSCGLSLTQWIRPVLHVRAPLVLVIALLSLGLSPWAVANSEELRRQMDSRDDVSAISPGVFRESRQAERVYFVEEVAGERKPGRQRVRRAPPSTASRASWWRHAASRRPRRTATASWCC